MLSNYNVVWTMESLPARPTTGPARTSPASRSCRTCRWPTSPSGWSRTTCSSERRHRGVDLPRDRACSPPTWERCSPNIVFGVPRVWEKLYAGVTAALAADPEKAEKFNEARRGGDAHRGEDDLGHRHRRGDRHLPVPRRRGLRTRARAASASTSARWRSPVPPRSPPQLISWFRTIGVPLAEVYGMSENTGPMTFERVKVKPGTVGRAHAGHASSRSSPTARCAAGAATSSRAT